MHQSPTAHGQSRGHGRPVSSKPTHSANFIPLGPYSALHPAGVISADLRKDVADVDCMLATTITLWLKKHGKLVKPKLTQEERLQLEECFELMDTDGSGAVDADELDAAFKVRESARTTGSLPLPLLLSSHLAFGL